MNSDVQIDGGMGEGGGQIVRSSLALSMLTGRPVVIDNVRQRRDKPGLMRQHLTAVLAAQAVCGATVKGAELRSRYLAFEPGPIQPGEHTFQIGTAGSATLVLQTVLPALLIADQPSRLVLEGGTHNPWSPPFDFLERVYLPLVNRMGPRVAAKLQRHGFYPAGGGRVVVDITPAERLSGFELLERGQIINRSIRALVANLPLQIAEREAATALSALGWDPACATVESVTAHGPGNVIMLHVHAEHVSELFVGFGQKGVRAEQVAEGAAREASEYLEANVPVGFHLADQLVLPLAISAWQATAKGAGAGGRFRTLPLTGHTTTHIEIIQRFIDVQFDISQSEGDGNCVVSVAPR